MVAVQAAEKTVEISDCICNITVHADDTTLYSNDILT